MFARVRAFLLAERKSLMLVAASVVATTGLTTWAMPAASRWLGRGAATTRTADPRFVALGRSYIPELGKAYSSAWDDGATALESGQAIGAALKVVSQSWEQGRTKLFDRLVTPELCKVVPDGKPEAELKDADKAAVARAWRGLAAGMKSTGRWAWPFGG
ncbi:hypothetical protein OJF2_72710 [Aquisphaera giovannonii]|uniref:Uncharacterized protein n=1 Tax=Aquisphaera giovannonii TaxID=406548 RepID=A0A5B9WF28_9BACT|nr:hypothetical protein [Aquisphaera giovannonii]QEH38665.1 hypothetical protein OJF2_72710 [Aquisphaera giovannonii]